MKLAEEKKVILLASDLDLSSGTEAVTKGINMKGYHHATFLISFGTLAGGNTTLKAYSGATDSVAATTSAIAFKYAYNPSTCIFEAAGATPASGADVLAAETTVVAATGLVVAYATYSNFMLVVEVDASDMDVANEEEWLYLEFTKSSTTGLATIFAILEPRYTSNRSATALA